MIDGCLNISCNEYSNGFDSKVSVDDRTLISENKCYFLIKANKHYKAFLKFTSSNCNYPKSSLSCQKSFFFKLWKYKCNKTCATWKLDNSNSFVVCDTCKSWAHKYCIVPNCIVDYFEDPTNTVFGAMCA